MSTSQITHYVGDDCAPDGHRSDKPDLMDGECVRCDGQGGWEPEDEIDRDPSTWTECPDCVGTGIKPVARTDLAKEEK